MTVSPKITWRQQTQKKIFLEQLGKTPIVSLVAEKTGIPRSTYYRWLESDPDFRKNAEKVYTEWVRWVNDMAVSQLMKLMKDGDRHALMFWLRTRDPEFWWIITRKPEKHEEDGLSEQERKYQVNIRLAELLGTRLKQTKENMDMGNEEEDAEKEENMDTLPSNMEETPS